ncbi:MAG: porin [Arenicella sp.]
MKKRLLTVLPVVLLAAGFSEMANALDVNLYGRVRLVLDYDNPDDGQTKLDVLNGSSRFGIKGSETLTDDLSAFYRAEFQYNAADGFNLNDEKGNDFRLRLGYAGIKGNWGSLQIGQDWTPMYSLVTSKVDDPEFYFGFGFGQNKGSSFRQNNMVKYNYTSTGYSNGNGFKFSGALIADGSDSGFTEFQPAIAYKAGPMYFGAVYRAQSLEGESDKDTLGLAFSWKPTSTSFIGMDYLDYSDAADSGNDEQSFDITGTVKVGNGLFLTSVYGMTDNNAGTKDVDNIVIQLARKFSKRTKIWVAATSSSDNVENTDRSRFQVGIRRNFF